MKASLPPSFFLPVCPFISQTQNRLSKQGSPIQTYDKRYRVLFPNSSAF